MTKYVHIRNVGKNGVISNMGGITLAYEVEGGKLKYGLAMCSQKDNFEKKVGRAIAKSRVGVGSDGVFGGQIEIGDEYVNADVVIDAVIGPMLESAYKDELNMLNQEIAKSGFGLKYVVYVGRANSRHRVICVGPVAA